MAEEGCRVDRRSRRSAHGRWLRPRRLALPLIALITLAVLLVAPHVITPHTRLDDGDSDPAVTHQGLLDAAAFVDGSVTPGPTAAPTDGLGPSTAPNLRVTPAQHSLPDGPLGRTDPALAASDDGRQILAGWTSADGFCGAPFGANCPSAGAAAGGRAGLSASAFSSDSGRTWSDGGVPPLGDHALARGSPWLDRGGVDGATYFFAGLAADDATGAPLGAGVSRGRFAASGTFAWQDGQVLRPADPGGIYDQPALAAARDGSGAAYLAVTDFIPLPCPNAASVSGPFGQIEVWRTHDGGASWQGPTIAGTDMTTADATDPGCGDSGVLQQNASVAIGPNGEVYVVWQLGPIFTPGGTTTSAGVAIARSLDGGVSFQPPVKITDLNSLRQDAPAGYNRARFTDPPRIVVATSGTHPGRIYVTYAAALAPVGPAPVAACPAGTSGVCIGQNLTSSQVYLTSSDDRGDTWSRPTPVAPAPPASGVKRFWPVVAVDQIGVVDVAYMESLERPTAQNATCAVTLEHGRRRAGPASSLVSVWWARSADGGATFAAPAQLSTAASNWCTAASNLRPNFGAGLSLGVVTGSLLILWNDGRGGLPEIEFAPADTSTAPS
jgi:hypothetical protein